MQVVEKTRHIDVRLDGEGVNTVVEILKKEIPSLVVLPDPDEDESILWDETQLAKELAASWHPGITVAIKREHLGMTQADLSEKTGLSIPSISLIENGRRPVGLRTAKKLAIALGITVDRLMRLSH